MMQTVKSSDRERPRLDRDGLTESALSALSAVKNVLRAEEHADDLDGWHLMALVAAREALEDYLRLRGTHQYARRARK